MADYSEGKIFSALMTRVSSLSLDPSLSVAWPNVAFTPPKDGNGNPSPYLRVTHLPNTTNPVTLGPSGENRHAGILQVSVVWPNGVGGFDPAEVAGAVAVHFKRGTALSHDGVIVRMVEPPFISPPVPGDAYYQVPVSIRYICDIPNP